MEAATGAMSAERRPAAVLAPGAVAALAAVLLCAACSPVYQLSELEGSKADPENAYNVPRLFNKDLFDAGIIFAGRPKREKILAAALKRFDLEAASLDFRDCAAEARDKPAGVRRTAGGRRSAVADCVPLYAGGEASADGAKTVDVPRPIAAIIGTAADVCIYLKYQQDTNVISQSMLLTIATAGLLTAGIITGAETATALGATGAGVAAADALSKGVPKPAGVAYAKVVQAGLSYYPFIQARRISGGKADENIAALSGLWDAAGTGCGTGVLKGRSRIWYPLTRQP